MKGLFKWDSPLMKKLALITNLVALNILWLLCCVPVVTIGTSTTALYYTVFQYLTEENDDIFRPFFRSIRDNFKQATLLWLPMLALMALLIFDASYLIITNDRSVLVWAVLISALLLLMLFVHLFPLLARFNMNAKALISTSFSLSLLHLPTTVLMVFLELLPLLVFLLAPEAFLQWSPLWVGLWYALVAYLNSKMLFKIWGKHMPSKEIECT